VMETKLILTQSFPHAIRSMGMKCIVAFISILAFGLANQGTNLLQEPVVEQGSPDELKGVMKVFVDTNISCWELSDPGSYNGDNRSFRR
jgi:hypothetical protein